MLKVTERRPELFFSGKRFLLSKIRTPVISSMENTEFINYPDIRYLVIRARFRGRDVRIIRLRY